MSDYKKPFFWTLPRLSNFRLEISNLNRFCAILKNACGNVTMPIFWRILLKARNSLQCALLPPLRGEKRYIVMKILFLKVFDEIESFETRKLVFLKQFSMELVQTKFWKISGFVVRKDWMVKMRHKTIYHLITSNFSLFQPALSNFHIFTGCYNVSLRNHLAPFASRFAVHRNAWFYVEFNAKIVSDNKTQFYMVWIFNFLFIEQVSAWIGPKNIWWYFRDDSILSLWDLKRCDNCV